MASNDLDDNFELLVNQIKQVPKYCEVILKELSFGIMRYFMLL